MKNFEKSAYTYRHRKAFLYLVNKIIKDEVVKKEMLKRARFHDLDKVVLYLFFDKKQASNYHRQTSHHHLENNIEKNFYDYLESIIDFECAAYTKPDKPLYAHDTILKFYKDNISSKDYNCLIDILNQYNLNSSYTVLDDNEGMEYMKTYQNVTEEMIIYEVFDYISNNVDNSFVRLKSEIFDSLGMGESK